MKSRLILVLALIAILSGCKSKDESYCQNLSTEGDSSGILYHFVCLDEHTSFEALTNSNGEIATDKFYSIDVNNKVLSLDQEYFIAKKNVNSKKSVYDRSGNQIIEYEFDNGYIFGGSSNIVFQNENENEIVYINIELESTKIFEGNTLSVVNSSMNYFLFYNNGGYYTISEDGDVILISDGEMIIRNQSIALFNENGETILRNMETNIFSVVDAKSIEHSFSNNDYSILDFDGDKMLLDNNTLKVFDTLFTSYEISNYSSILKLEYDNQITLFYDGIFYDHIENIERILFDEYIIYELDGDRQLYNLLTENHISITGDLHYIIGIGFLEELTNTINLYNIDFDLILELDTACFSIDYLSNGFYYSKYTILPVCSNEVSEELYKKLEIVSKYQVIDRYEDNYSVIISDDEKSLITVLNNSEIYWNFEN